MKHKHHIVPRYRCKDLGIDPDFDDNFADMTRHQHALIHWGYYCEDLSPLLEVCNPPQYVLDMISLGDNRDGRAAVLLAKHEIDELDLSGENHPMYGIPRSEETKRKISIAQKGRTSPLKGISRIESLKNIEYEEFMEKISGENHWTHGLEPGEHPMCGIPCSEETKKKLSIAHTGKVVSEETKEKLRIVRQKQINDDEYLKKYKEGVKRAGLKRRGENNHNYGKPMTQEIKKKVSESKKKFFKDNPDIAKTWVKRGEESSSYIHGKAINVRNDPEAMKAYKADYYQKNKEAHLKKCKERRSKMTREQKDEKNRKQRECRANNREQSLKYGREYREKNREKISKYRKEYSEKNKKRKQEYDKKYHAKKKLEKQGKGTLDSFL